MNEKLKSLLERIEALLAAIPFLRTVFTLALVILLLVNIWPWIQRLPLWPITTKGHIFVESPEIYTRERLVNDRYSQAFWLEQQLRKLDEATNFTAVNRDLALKLTVGTGGEANLPTLTQLSTPPFQHEYEIRSALRARIRQALLENQLDDRHDLTGNSVYGLKFDTSVIPGTNTRTRAYVRVRVVPPEQPGPELLPDLLSQSLDELRSDTPDNKFRHFPEHYENWIASIEWRLNSYLADIPEYDDREAVWPCIKGELSDGQKELTRKILAEALAKVLAIDERKVVFPDQLFPETPDGGKFGANEKFDLPEPWKRYLQVAFVHNDTCRNWKQFEVSPLRQYLLITEDAEIGKLDDVQQGEFSKAYFQNTRQGLTDADGAETTYVISSQRTNPDGKPWPSREEFEGLKLQFKLDGTSLAKLISHSAAYDRCIAPLDLPASAEDCAATGKSIAVEVGMYNFAQKILDADSYLYTVFPKSDVSGVLERSLMSSVMGLDITGGQGSLSSSSAEAASQLVASQLSFSDEEVSGEIVFGWIVGSEGVQQPVQKSQFVLLSLPAHLPLLNLQLDTGWLDRNSAFHPDKTGMTMNVALPPDYEAFDTLISGSKRYGPAIFDRLMERKSIHACRSASILIPGARLWRSSLVTLAGQPADQISVMPNMRGIIAHYKQVPPLESGAALLQVWTSEGSDRIDDRVTIINEGSDDCPPNPAAGQEPAAKDAKSEDADQTVSKD
ncbi:hypothetical protein QO034_11360 [Sedimentitalea sp. JM2-8]|uniref:Uncharacterized protein n=1 Tax=Sedimentitalea xiamensis TaxID=3050037 RepID=A0ABT7FEZ7_9RHOB|nr:hypothetical protein [Sedimentitalea xiamensis]MDK3073711.1 hypothetical protein [Sedimentitalea xiamensis]